jgi:hypothetical protein
LFNVTTCIFFIRTYASAVHSLTGTPFKVSIEQVTVQRFLVHCSTSINAVAACKIRAASTYLGKCIRVRTVIQYFFESCLFPSCRLSSPDTCSRF